MKFNIFVAQFHECLGDWCSECQDETDYPVAQIETETREKVVEMLNLHEHPDGGYVVFGLHKSPRVYIAPPPIPPPVVTDRQGLLHVLQEGGYLGKNKKRKEITA